MGSGMIRFRWLVALVAIVVAVGPGCAWLRKAPKAPKPPLTIGQLVTDPKPNDGKYTFKVGVPKALVYATLQMLLTADMVLEIERANPDSGLIETSPFTVATTTHCDCGRIKPNKLGVYFMSTQGRLTFLVTDDNMATVMIISRFNTVVAHRKKGADAPLPAIRRCYTTYVIERRIQAELMRRLRPFLKKPIRPRSLSGPDKPPASPPRLKSSPPPKSPPKQADVPPLYTPVPAPPGHHMP